MVEILVLRWEEWARVQAFEIRDGGPGKGPHRDIFWLKDETSKTASISLD
jgi:hypothetical protein